MGVGLGMVGAAVVSGSVELSRTELQGIHYLSDCYKLHWNQIHLYQWLWVWAVQWFGRLWSRVQWNYL